MANTLSNTLDKIGNVVESIMSATNKATQYEGSNRVYMGQTCLERFGMEARNAHLLRNEWRKDLAYSKPLVDAEYMIQTEFKVSSYEDRLNEQAQESAEKADKQAEKKAKKAAKDAKKAEKTKVKEERKESKETLYRDAYTSLQAENAVNFMRNQKINLG